MGKNTTISWCNHTHNCWWGCTKVGQSPACGNCYAETWAKRTGFQVWGDDAPRRYFGDKHWNEPLKWDAEAAKSGIHARVFCMSMGDWAEGRPEQRPHLERLWDLILKTRNLDWLMLTKRPQLITKLCPLRSQRIWQGTTTETQAWLDLRWEHLKRVDSEIYWLSIEPLFERIRLPEDLLRLGKRAWVVVGGESGTHARQMNPDWARSLRDQCQEAGVPFHMKQMSGRTKEQLTAIPADLMIREFPTPVPELVAP
jgi:protein gp37